MEEEAQKHGVALHNNQVIDDNVANELEGINKDDELNDLIKWIKGINQIVRIKNKWKLGKELEYWDIEIKIETWFDWLKVMYNYGCLGIDDPNPTR